MIINEEVIDFLNRLGFKTLQEQNRQGENALHYAVFWDDKNMVMALIDEGIDVNKKGENGFTPLHEAVDKNNKEIVKILLEKGASKEISNDLGEKPVDIAREFDYTDIVHILESGSGEEGTGSGL